MGHCDFFESPESSSTLKKKNMAAKSAVRALDRDKERGRERERDRERERARETERERHKQKKDETQRDVLPRTCQAVKPSSPALSPVGDRVTNPPPVKTGARASPLSMTWHKCPGGGGAGPRSNGPDPPAKG